MKGIICFYPDNLFSQEVSGNSGHDDLILNVLYPNLSVVLQAFNFTVYCSVKTMRIFPLTFCHINICKESSSFFGPPYWDGSAPKNKSASVATTNVYSVVTSFSVV